MIYAYKVKMQFYLRCSRLFFRGSSECCLFSHYRGATLHKTAKTGKVIV